jgi:alpha-galactosidase
MDVIFMRNLLYKSGLFDVCNCPPMKLVRFGKIWILGLMLLRTTMACAFAGFETNQFHNIQREPDSVSVVTGAGSYELKLERKGIWTNDNVEVKFRMRAGGLAVDLAAPGAAVKWLQIRWNAPMASDWKYLGDAWERAYGDLEWKTLDAKRMMPWYFLATDGKVTHGYGVMTGPGALCYWTADENGITLHADVHCGGTGVELGNGKLEVCTVVCRCGRSNETPFAAARAFCKLMCPNPRLPKQPVYGFNDWYCAYGHDTADNFLTNVAYVVSLSPKNGNRPFAVVDDGWQYKGQDEKDLGLWNWNRVNPRFSTTLTMNEFAKQIIALGARPGLWYRPLIAQAGQPQSWRLQRDPEFLDPTVPQVRALIRGTVARFHDWGYQFIKHDFTTYDICGRWGNHMGAEVTPDGWAFADRSKTTAEVIRDLYHDIREAAGNDVLVEGCNTMSHLAAGLFEMQRIGDDVSGRDWNRTRKMGVNSLAFRAPQNGTFYTVDADCVGQMSSNSVLWAKNSQWLDLLAHSDTALFVSFPRDTVSTEREKALRAALIAASRPQPLAEPLDWLTQRTPTRWLLDDKEVSFSW